MCPVLSDVHEEIIWAKLAVQMLPDAETRIGTAPRCPQGEVVVATKSGHDIRNDEPRLVIDAVQRVVRLVNPPAPAQAARPAPQPYSGSGADRKRRDHPSSFAVMLYLKPSGSRLSSRPLVVSPCGYMK